MITKLLRPHTHFRLFQKCKNFASSNNPSLSALLRPEQLQFISEQRKMFDDLYKLFSKMGLDKEVLDLVVDSKSKIDDLFMVVVVGEYNAGKSTFINALLGKKYLLDGVLPTTNKICVLRSSLNMNNSETLNIWKRSENIIAEDVEELHLPVPWLNHIALIDTPGTNAIITRHELLTQNIVPRADLVLFITSAERPISESENLFLHKISQWGKKIIIIVNKMDTIELNYDKQRIIEYVSQNASKSLGSYLQTIPIFAVSGKQGLSAKLISPEIHPSEGLGSKFWALSNLGSVEEYLHSVLSEKELIINKLKNPLITADRLLNDAIILLQDRKRYLEGDQRILEFIHENMSIFEMDLDRDLKYYIQQIQQLIYTLSTRVDIFLNENIHILNTSFLFDPLRFKQEFQKEIIIDISKTIDKMIEEITLLIIQRFKNQSKSIMEYIHTRSYKYKEEMIGTIKDTTYDHIHTELILILKNEITTAMTTYQPYQEIEHVTKSVTTAYTQSTGLQGLSAVSLGTLLTAQMLDVTGIVFISSTAFLSLVIVPRQKQVLRENFQQKFKLLQQKLEDTIKLCIDKGRQQGRETLYESIGPYSRHIRIETEKNQEYMNNAIELRNIANELKTKCINTVS